MKARVEVRLALHAMYETVHRALINSTLYQYYGKFRSTSLCTVVTVHRRCVRLD